MPGPLDGIRVLDLTMNVMGPLAAQILGDMGADVCKVEPPEGETLRRVGHVRRTPTMASQFLHINRNKRSLAIDLKSPSASEAMRRLVTRSDVLICSMRPQAMARLGLDYPAVSALNPRLVYASAFGYGQNGPYAAKPAYDDLIQAALGAPVLQAGPDGEPRYMATNLVDRACGMALASAIGMALFYRERTGKGQAIELPMFETMAQFVYGDHMSGHTFDPPMGPPRYARMLERRPFRTRDGYIGVLMFTDRHWQRFFEAMGTPERAKAHPFTSVTTRSQHTAEVTAFQVDLFASNTTAHWLRLLDAADVPAMEVKTPEALLEDPHMTAVGFFRRIEHPTEGTVRTFGVPSRWSVSQPDIRREAPQIGQHTREILGECGFSAAEIDGMLAEGVVVAAG